MADAVRKNYDGAADNYQAVPGNRLDAESGHLVRLAQVYMGSGKLDNAIVHAGQGHQHAQRSGRR